MLCVFVSAIAHITTYSRSKRVSRVCPWISWGEARYAGWGTRCLLTILHVVLYKQSLTKPGAERERKKRCLPAARADAAVLT